MALRLAVSPDGRWIAAGSGSEDIIRLWPMPDVAKPPLYTLPLDELLEVLAAMQGSAVRRATVEQAALLVGELGIPWIFCSGDAHACREAEAWVPGIVTALPAWLG